MKTRNFIYFKRDLKKGELLAEALILVTTEVGMMEEVHEKVRDMEEVKKAAMITGPYDVMVMAKAESMEEISKILVQKIRNIDGVKNTVTNVVIS